MTMKFSAALRNNRAQQIIDAIDADINPGTIKFYTGPQPVTGAAITTEILLGTLTFSAISATATDGVITFDEITEDSEADATGTAAWARIEDGSGAFVMDVSVGATGSGETVEMNTTGIVEGGPIRITSFVITEGNA